MASLVNFRVSPGFFINCDSSKPRSSLKKSHSLGANNESSTLVSSDSVVMNGAPNGPQIKDRESTNGALISDLGNGRFKPKANGVVEKKEKEVKKVEVLNELELLWDDGYGTRTVKDYLEAAKDMIKHDGGPPRWFSPVDCGEPLKGSPILLFLPGLDGVGLGLTLHHKALGKVFEVRCLHIPVNDRTSFPAMVKLVEETVRLEHAASPNKPIYLVGDSFGGCLALAVAARNPTIDLVVILANPATSFKRSYMQPFFPLLGNLPQELHLTVPYLLSFIMGDPVKMAMVNIEKKLPPRFVLEQLSSNLTGLLPALSTLADVIPKDTLVWKLNLLDSATAYTNSRLHAVNAEVLVLASGKDYMLPSADEAQRLKHSLKNSIVRYFKDNGHTLLLEDGLNLLTVIKGTGKYRRSRKHDQVLDFLPPSKSEYDVAFSEVVGLLRYAASASFFSTLEDGKIVKGLAGIPNEGPVLFVGYHNLMGFEIYPLVEEFLREKRILVHGVAHPDLFNGRLESSLTEFSVQDWLKVFGAVSVSASNLFRLLQKKSHVLLYPGGAREALHYKDFINSKLTSLGEEYKLFWPKDQEFVRMAARFGATIVPFGAVGEDDLAQLALDYNDMMNIPILNDYVKDLTSNATRLRDETDGEVANQRLFLPGLLPKIPGRFYYLFGKPIETKGREKELKDKDKANELYLEVKSQVEHKLAYLLKKRENDPYRSIIDRAWYRMVHSPFEDIPAFEP